MFSFFVLRSVFKKRKYVALLTPFLPLGPLRKQQILDGMKSYSRKLGVPFGTADNTMGDQAWAIKRLSMDVESVKRNSTTGARLPDWLKSLVSLWPGDIESDGTSMQREASPEVADRTRALFRCGSTPPSVRKLRRQNAFLVDDIDAAQELTAQKEIDNKKEI